MDTAVAIMMKLSDFDPSVSIDIQKISEDVEKIEATQGKMSESGILKYAERYLLFAKKYGFDVSDKDIIIPDYDYTLDISQNIYDVSQIMAPTYVDAKRISLDSFSLAIPDHFRSTADSKDVDDQFLFLAVPSEFKGTLADYKNAPIGIGTQRMGSINGLASLWKTETKDRVCSQLRNMLDNQGKQYQQQVAGCIYSGINDILVDDEFYISYCALIEGTDDDVCYRAYNYNIICSDVLYGGMIYFNYSPSDSGIHHLDKIVEEWLRKITRVKE